MPFEPSGAASPCILIGASAGGVTAMLALAAALAPDFPAPILVVQHIGAHRSQLAQLLAARGPNRAVQASDGDTPVAGTIHVAPPDQHMLIEHGRIRLTRGPKEHHARPAIDPLFRSAAIDLGPRAVGVILTGMLDDGSAGLQTIKDCGGVAVVQDPAGAYEPSMPRAALAATPVDHVVGLSELPSLLTTLAHRHVPPRPWSVPDRARREHAISLGDSAMEHLEAIGRPSVFTCPDCGGVLFELGDTGGSRYRCHTGHAFSLRTLAATLEQVTDVALWAGLRALREKEVVLRRLVEVEADSEPVRAQQSLREAEQLAATIASLRTVTLNSPASFGFD